MITRFLVSILVALPLLSCSKGSTPPEEALKQSASTSTQTPAQTAATQGTPMSTGRRADQDADEEIVGAVVSIINVADSKTMYIELNNNGETLWVATKTVALQKGDRVKVASGAIVMENFTSKSLDRTFDRLLMASGVTKVQ